MFSEQINMVCIQLPSPCSFPTLDYRRARRLRSRCAAILGLDFGTSNSAVAVLCDSKAVILGETLPSVVAYTQVLRWKSFFLPVGEFLASHQPPICRIQCWWETMPRSKLLPTR